MEAGSQGWLGHEHGLRGAADIAAASDFEEALNLGEQHSSDIEPLYGDVKGDMGASMAGGDLCHQE
jgi:hypothetical protein